MTYLENSEILKLYPEYNSVLGPYVRKDGRQHIVLNNTNLPKTNKRKIKTISYPKVLVEVRESRILIGNETVDHIDNNKFNNESTNLQILSRAANASKSATGNKYLLGYVQSEEHKRTGSKNGAAKLTYSEVLDYRLSFGLAGMSKKEIMEETNMSYKSISNFINGDTYKDVPFFY